MSIKRTAIATVAAATLLTGIGFGATAANAATTTPTAAAAAVTKAAPTPQVDIPVSVTIDPVAAAKMITDAVHESENKGAFVENLLNNSWINIGQQKVSVMVANLSSHPAVDVYNILPNGYYSASCTDGTIYGIWFLAPGHNVFTNNGDMGYENWAWQGAGWTRSDDKRTITFN